MNNEHREFTRFVLHLICNNCGIPGRVQLQWSPNMHFVGKCFTCGNAEIINVGPPELIEKEELKEVEAFDNMVKKILEEKTKKPETN